MADEQLPFKAITYNQWLLLTQDFESMGALPKSALKFAAVTRSSFTSDNENVLFDLPQLKMLTTNLKKITDQRHCFR